MRKILIVGLVIGCLCLQAPYGSPTEFVIPTSTKFVGYGTSAHISFQNICNITFSSTNLTELTIVCDPTVFDTVSKLNITFENSDIAYLVVVINTTDSALDLTENRIVRNTDEMKYRFTSGVVIYLETNVSAQCTIAYATSDTALQWLYADYTTGDFISVPTSRMGEYVLTTFETATFQCFFLASPIDDSTFTGMIIGSSVIGITLYGIYIYKKKQGQCPPTLKYDTLTRRCGPPISK